MRRDGLKSGQSTTAEVRLIGWCRERPRVHALWSVPNKPFLPTASPRQNVDVRPRIEMRGGSAPLRDVVTGDASVFQRFLLGDPSSVTRDRSFWRQALEPWGAIASWWRRAPWLPGDVGGGSGSRSLAGGETQLQSSGHGVLLKVGRRASVVLPLIRVAAHGLGGWRGTFGGRHVGSESSILADSWSLGGHPIVVERRPIGSAPIVAGS